MGASLDPALTGTAPLLEKRYMAALAGGDHAHLRGYKWAAVEAVGGEESQDATWALPFASW